MEASTYLSIANNRMCDDISNLTIFIYQNVADFVLPVFLEDGRGGEQEGEMGRGREKGFLCTTLQQSG